MRRAVSISIAWGLPVAILLGPRVGLPAVPLGDFRIQDFVVAGAVGYFFLVDLIGRSRHSSSQRVVAVFWGVALAGLSYLFFLAAVSADLFRFFYVIRLLEPVMIALLMYRALEVLGRRGVLGFVWATAAATAVNLIWVFLQYFLVSYGALWDFSQRPSVEAYGPGLIGDGAPFPAGQTLVVVLAGLVSTELSEAKLPGLIQVLRAALIGALFGAIVLVESRISIAGGFLLVFLWVSLKVIVVFRFSMAKAVGMGLIVVGSPVLVLSALPRFDLERIRFGWDSRFGSLFPSTLERLENQFLVGAGAGALRAETGWEYHSLFLGMLSSFGIIGLTFYAFLMLSVMWHGAGLGMRSADPWTRVFGFWATAFVANLLFAGVLQDSYIAVAPNHLGALVVGAFFWLLWDHGAKRNERANLSKREI